jgi:hypothetical protein
MTITGVLVTIRRATRDSTFAIANDARRVAEPFCFAAHDATLGGRAHTISEETYFLLLKSTELT